MMGIPGSGKSTFAKSILRPQDIYVSRDEIRFKLLKENDDYFSKEKKVVKIFQKEINKSIKKNLKNNEDIVVYADATNLNPKSRNIILQNLKYKPNNIVVLFMDTQLKTCIERNELRSGRQHVPENTIIDMYNRISLPTKEEKVDKILIIRDSKIYKEIRLWTNY